MTINRSTTASCASLLGLAFALATLLAACAAPGEPGAPAVQITSHVDDQRVYGDRTITLAGSAANVDQVEVLLGGSVVATVAVASNAFAAEVTLGDNRNEVLVRTPDGDASDAIELVYPWVDAFTFRPMDVVIGQTDKVSNEMGTSATQLGFEPYASALYVGGILYVPDANNNRVLGFIGLPTTDGAAADFVLGQASFTANAPNDDDQDGMSDATPSARTMAQPSGLATDGTRLLVADGGNRRVLVYESLPTTSFAAADVVVGQASMTATEFEHCSLDAPFSFSERIAVGGGRLVVPEHAGNRVLIWNSIPTENGVEPDLVLGQPGTGATCEPNDDDQAGMPGANPTARTMHRPWDAWTDGERLLVADSSNRRVLLWTSFPTSDFAPADVVIGQDGMTSNASGAGATGFGPTFSVASNGNQILVPDSDRSRVLVFNAFPTSNGAAADAVLGQSSFTNTASNDDDQDGDPDANPSARTLREAYGAWLGEGVMVITDLGNARYALFVD